MDTPVPVVDHLHVQKRWESMFLCSVDQLDQASVAAEAASLPDKGFVRLLLGLLVLQRQRIDLLPSLLGGPNSTLLIFGQPPRSGKNGHFKVRTVPRGNPHQSSNHVGVY